MRLKPAEIKHWIRRRRPRDFVALGLALFLFGRLAWFWYLSAPARQITIGRETTRLDGPLGPDGCVDYIAAVERQAAVGATPENNAVVLLWQAFGAKETTVERWAEQFQRLGAPVPANSTVESIPLDLLIEASQRTHYYAPLMVSSDEQRHLWSVLLPLTQSSREGLTRLVNRAGQRISTGDFDSAWSDGLACHRLARLLALDPFLISSLRAFHDEGMALDFDAALLNTEDLTGDRARRCLADLRSLAPMPTVADKLDSTERLCMLDAAMVVARGDTIGTTPDDQLHLALPGAIDWNVVLRTINEYYDRYVAAVREPDKAARDVQLTNLAEQRVKLPAQRMSFALQSYLGRRDQASRDLAHVIIGSTAEFFLTAHEQERSLLARQRAVKVGFALTAWRREQGEFPDALAALVPEFFAEVPVDPQTGEALLYRRTETGFEIFRAAAPPDDVILRVGKELE